MKVLANRVNDHQSPPPTSLVKNTKMILKSVASPTLTQKIKNQPIPPQKQPISTQRSPSIAPKQTSSNAQRAFSIAPRQTSPIIKRPSSSVQRSTSIAKEKQRPPVSKPGLRSLSFRKDKPAPRCYHYQIGPFNNQEDVIRAMRTRPHWREGSDQEVINFEWKTSSKGMNFTTVARDSKQVLNHFEFHKLISTKFGLFESLSFLAEKKKFDIFGIIPLTFSFDSTSNSFTSELAEFERFFKFVKIMNESGRTHQFEPIHQVVQNIQKTIQKEHIKSISKIKKSSNTSNVKNGLKDKKESEAKAQVNTKVESEEERPGSKEKIKVEGESMALNNLEESKKEIKDANDGNVVEEELINNQKEVRDEKEQEKEKETDPLDIQDERDQTSLPQSTVSLNQEVDFKKFASSMKSNGVLTDISKEACRQRRLSHKSAIDYSKTILHPCQNEGHNLWILKASGLNRGFGIEIFSTLERLKELLKNFSNGYEEKIVQNNEVIVREKGQIRASRFIIQKYIERPLLYQNKKFDLRVWVMITHELKGYVFNECYVRVSSEPFSTSSHEKFIHLTNNALQKYSENYDEDETLIDTYQLEAETKLKYPDFNFREHIWSKVIEQTRLAIECCHKKLSQFSRKLSFEIFGFDFMIDEQLNTWLIEANTNPSITTPGTLLKKLVPRMLNDAFKLTLDEIFPIKEDMKEAGGNQEVEKFPIDGYSDDENVWKLIFDSK